MGKEGIEEQPQSAVATENADVNAANLMDEADAAFVEHGAESVKHGEEPAEELEETPDAEEEETGEEPDADEAEEEEESAEEEDSNVFSEEGYKIFKARVGKEKAKREKVEKELETARTELDELKKVADPNVQSAMATGLDPRFIETKDAETLAESAKVENRISWLERQAENPDGYEDANGNVWTQSQLLLELTKQTRLPENQKVLARASSIRETAITRQAEVIEAGLKALADQEKAAAALKKKPAKKAPSAPAPGQSTAAPSHQPGKAAPGALDTRALHKKGNTRDALAEVF